MTIADAHFTIGKTHEVCQDYATADDQGQSGLSSMLAHAVVCDGCSSSPDTDWGARFLARAGASALQPFDALNVVRRADSYRKALELAPTALDATLLLIRETPQGDAEVTVCGDGVVVAQRRDGTGYAHWSLSFNNNAPAYLSYLLDLERLATYQKTGCGFLTVKGDEYPVKEWDPAVPPPLGIHFHKVFPRAKYDLVLVLSDGAESFWKREGTRFVPVPLADVLTQVLDFKTLTHGFIKRRVGRFLTKFCTENGWQHNDDFAVAGLVLDRPEVAL